MSSRHTSTSHVAQNDPGLQISVPQIWPEEDIVTYIQQIRCWSAAGFSTTNWDRPAGNPIDAPVNINRQDSANKEGTLRTQHSCHSCMH